MKPDYSVDCEAAERAEIFEAVWCLTHDQYMVHCGARAPLDRKQTAEEKHYGAIARSVHKRITSQITALTGDSSKIGMIGEPSHEAYDWAAGFEDQTTRQESSTSERKP